MATDARILYGAPSERESGVRRHEFLVATVAVGVLAGIAMMAWIAVRSAIVGLPPARPLALAAATLLGPGALDGSPGALLAGGALWLVVSAALTLPFAAILPRDRSLGCAAIVGVGYSFVVMAIVTMLVLPAVNPLMREEMSGAGGSWVLAYAVFGVGLAFVPAVRRRIVAR